MNECLVSTIDEPKPTTAIIKRALLDAIDFGLLAPGEIVRATIYERIERSYQVAREEIPDNLDTFHRALEELLGKSAEVVRRLIAKNLYSRLDLKFTEHENWTLVDYVRCAKKARQR